MEQTADIALIGLAVMGQNLIMNMNDHGYTVVAYNRTTAKVDEFLNDAAKGRTTILGAHSIEEMVKLLKRPRKIMLMVKAGKPVDEFIETLLPHLEPGDLIIDGGNSHFPDTIRRTNYLESKGLLFIGTGVSGGEEGARFGPSMMPGGSVAAWPLVKDIFQAICAKTPEGEACCEWVGRDGAGHYVKMVHNGIEYGDMQLICEAYQLMKGGLGLSNEEMHEVFAEWNKGELDSYLIEITRDILGYKDPETGEAVVDKILDTAGQKGTGKWTSESSLDLGMPVTLIGEAVYARCLSAMKDDRVAASKILSGPKFKFDGDRKAYIEDIRQALLASKIVSYAQGFMLLREAAKEYKWDLHYGEIAMMWRAGCIIRSAFLGKIKAAFATNPNLSNLLLDGYFKDVIDRCQPSWRRVVAKAVEAGVAVPAFMTASRSLTAIAASACRRICCRRSAITSARTPTSASTSRAASSSTPTGRARAATSRPERTRYKTRHERRHNATGIQDPPPVDGRGRRTDGREAVQRARARRQDGGDQRLRFPGRHRAAMDGALGIATGLISGRVSPATVERATQCKFKYIYQGHTEKIPILQEILADAKIAPEEVAYIGDDFTDVVVMRRVGFAIATANARPEMKPIAHYVTEAPGGQGAVREVIELLLKAQGKWDEILKHYEICLEK